MTRRILESLQLDKIAAVDRPCQEHAVVTIIKREFSDEERAKMADKGHAMSDGSYPIGDKKDLSNAIQAIGRTPHYHAVRRHIISRAKDLGATDQLPDHWNVQKVLRAADIITKDLIMLPMAMPESGGAESFQAALDAALACKAESVIKDQLWPLQDALRDSVISIMMDKSLDQSSRVMMTRNSVEDFLSTVQVQFPDYYAKIRASVLSKRLLTLKKAYLMERLELLRLPFLKRRLQALKRKVNL